MIEVSTNVDDSARLPESKAIVFCESIHGQEIIKVIQI
jgi:hypothetical protein